ncbi:cytochrome P450 2K1-like isoform X1 [Sander lucioperca]|uniref:cytochrome P450 2K1-like isoform X1 n=1 Tax=Sander lucioperca TaxID=283035 RepID=UPI0016538F2F|nr:cytochrome P450 2K1-like isoform X1 [Sander lucioperca]
MGILDLFLQSTSSISLLGGLVVLLLFYLVFSSSFSSKEDRKEPPGPKPLPLFGNLLQLDLKRPHLTLLKLSKKYGSVFTVYLGPKKVVVLAGYKTVKEALVNHAEEFGERDPMPIMHEYNRGHGKERKEKYIFLKHCLILFSLQLCIKHILLNHSGILWSNGDSWKEMKHFALTNLRDFGMGRKASEDKIIEECDHLIGVLKKFKGEAFDTTQPIKYAVCNIICSMVYGSRFEYDDPEFTSLVDCISARVHLLGSTSIQVYNMFPRFCKWIANRKSFLRLGAASIRQNLQLFSRLKETLNPQMCRGFVDAFLVRKQKLEKSGITNSHFHDENLMITVQNLFSAGTDASAITLRWGLLLMAKYPKIQDQVQEEVSREIGSRQVQVEDRKNLHFTNAVIHETQRLATIVVSIPHKTTQDVTFQGYVIKKGTAVTPLLTSVLYDESEWERPHSFYPAHFLDKDGKFVKREAFMPFSAGHRACPGESLARMELFIFFTTLLQHFRFTPPPGVSEDELDLTPHVGFTLDPLPHKLCAAPVHEEEEGLRI